METALTQTWHYVDHWANTRPDGEAVVFQDRRLNWKAFSEAVDAAAAAMLKAGVSKGDRVAMLAMARPEFLITFMAANKIGAVWLGLNPKFTLDELRYQIQDSAPRLLFAVDALQGQPLTDTLEALQREDNGLEQVVVMGTPPAGMESFDDFVAAGQGRLPEVAGAAARVEPTDDALIMYTSGSTGKPKGVVHTHASIIANIRNQAVAFGMDENTRALLHFPINHVAADVEIGFGTLYAGGCVVCMEGFDPVESIRVVRDERVTLLGQVPAMFLLQFQQPGFNGADLAGVRTFVWAGSPAPALLVQGLSAIAAQSGAVLVTGYGSTETCGFITYTRPGDDASRLVHTAGTAAPGFALRIVDDAGEPLDTGRIGEIAVQGPFLFDRYWKRPDLTDQVMRDGWYLTGDMGFLDQDGYIHITGRRSDMFKTGGENVYPREVEEVVELDDGVLFAAVIAVPDPVFQEVGWAYVMKQPGRETDADRLQALCREKLANYKVPKRFFVRDSLPLLPNGKVDKQTLKREAEAELAGKARA
ncbi:MAG: AMP-binding protein [Ectothiorhodospiraceae bacterium]|nr:AMP-binding protein [Ectothiorhodospiraceae bacterium]